MIAFPNAKINLGLNIVSKREDRYHDIESGFYPIPWKDALEIIPSNVFSFQSYGLEIPGDTSNNLCVKAYDLLHRNFGIEPVKIILLKKIPMGAGLGGGSADGAFTLTLLNDLFELNLHSDQLKKYALELGSDCPFFIENQPAIAQGRGEILEAIPLFLQGKYLAIKNPGIHVSTKEAYEGVKPKTPEKSIKQILSLPMEKWRNLLVNDFESSVFNNYPEIKTLKDELYTHGALYASMSGSGSTVYGLFESQPNIAGYEVMAL